MDSVFVDVSGSSASTCCWISNGCVFVTDLQGIFSSWFCSDAYLRLLAVHGRRASCMILSPGKPHKKEINNREVFMRVFSPLCVAQQY